MRTKLAIIVACLCMVACGSKNISYIALDDQPGAGAELLLSDSSGIIKLPSQNGNPEKVWNVLYDDNLDVTLKKRPLGEYEFTLTLIDGPTLKFTGDGERIECRYCAAVGFPKNWKLTSGN